MSKNRSPRTVEEMVDSLTGFDEIAIERHFDGFDVYTDSEAKGVKAARVLAFVDFTRQGLSAPDARNAALALTVGEVTDYFAEAEPELDADDPITESGKDDASAT